jgi:nucleoside transporter
MFDERRDSGTTAKLSVMMFLQFFTWGAWFVTLWMLLVGADLGDIIRDSYRTAPIAAIIAPLFLGLVADRFFSSQKLMGVLMLVGGGVMLAVPKAIATGNSTLVFWLFMVHMLCFMPTLALGNTISFSHLPTEAFPKVRVWGTIGWIVAGLVGGGLGWSGDLRLFTMAGGSAVVLGVFCFSLPKTPPPLAGKPIDVRSLLMLDAFKLLTKPAFGVFIFCSMLICIPLAYYFVGTSGYLTNMGYKQAISTMTIGQMSEIFFMLLIPFFFRKLGVKTMILIGMGAWVLRYLLFAYGATDQVVWMLFAGIALHGICYDFFFVTGFMYTDRVAPKAIRGQAQSMLVFFTQGIGMLIGYTIEEIQSKKVADSSGALAAEISEARADDTLGYFDKLMQMFAVEMLDAVQPATIAAASADWKAYWMVPALMAAGVGVLFFVAFWDKVSPTEKEEDDELAEIPADLDEDC